jgi:hypothetical protein
MGSSFWILLTLLFKAVTKAPQPAGLASKIVTNVWAVLSLAFAASYTANLAAFMIIKDEFTEFNGVEDPRLLNPYGYKPPIRFATVRSGSTEEIISKNYPQMFEYMRPYMVNNVQEGIDKVKRKLVG